MNSLSDFSEWVRAGIISGDIDPPGNPAAVAAIMAWLCALVPEYEIQRAIDQDNAVIRKEERRNAILSAMQEDSGNGRRPASPADNRNGNSRSRSGAMEAE